MVIQKVGGRVDGDLVGGVASMANRKVGAVLWSAVCFR